MLTFAAFILVRWHSWLQALALLIAGVVLAVMAMTMDTRDRVWKTVGRWARV